MTTEDNNWCILDDSDCEMGSWNLNLKATTWQENQFEGTKQQCLEVMRHHYSENQKSSSPKTEEEYFSGIYLIQMFNVTDLSSGTIEPVNRERESNGD